MLRRLRITCLVAGLLALKAGCGGRSEDAVEPLDSPPLDVTVVNACLRLLSCPSDVTHRSVSECLVMNGGPFMNPDRERIVTGVNTFKDTRSASIACINDAAADCVAIASCATGKRGDCAGLPAGGEAVCEGDLRVSCREGVRRELDCTTKDCERTFSCDEQPKAAACLVASGGAECGFELCSKEDFREVCDGNARVFCLNGVVKHEDCSSIPGSVSKCGERPGGGVGCIAAAPACSPEARAHCEGSDVVSCTAGSETRRQCGTYPIPMVCGVEEPCGPDKSCVTCVPSPRLRCDPRKHVDRCNGTRVVYCDGQEREVDCVSLGFRECTVATGTATCR